MTPGDQGPRAQPAIGELVSALAEVKTQLSFLSGKLPQAEALVSSALDALTRAEGAARRPPFAGSEPGSELQELRSRERELELALQARDEFLVTLGHELRNPLSPVFLQLKQLVQLARNAPHGILQQDAVLPRLEQFAQRFQRFLQTLNRILEVSRINSGRVELSIQEVDLVQVAREVAASLSPEAAAAGSELQVQTAQAVIGKWDKLRLEQICMNLISNAIRYGLGRPIQITVTADPKCARLSVADQGLGIAMIDRERIFQPFERGAGVRAAGGFGVGLWIVKNLCGALGGRVDVQSQLGKGSTFIVTLPRGEES